jgi:hypothetical protein
MARILASRGRVVRCGVRSADYPSQTAISCVTRQQHGLESKHTTQASAPLNFLLSHFLGGRDVRAWLPLSH